MSERMDQKNFKNAAIIGVISANCCNPNGDPGNNNRPRVHRINGLEYGWISMYRIKRFIRDTAEALFDKKILAKSGTAFNEEKGLIDLKVPPKKKGGIADLDMATENIQKIRNTYWDIKQFGMVCTGSVASKVSGNNILGIWNIGAVSLSLLPIEICEYVITRCFTSTTSKEDAKDTEEVIVGDSEELDESDETDVDEEPVVGAKKTAKAKKEKVSKNQNMGSQKIVLKGYYRVVMQLNSAVAQKFGYTEEDIEEFYEVVCEMFNGSVTSGSSKYGMGWLEQPKLIMGESGSIEHFESKMGIERSDKNADNTTPISLIETVKMVWN